jgi:hypothetical protein
MAKNDKKNKQKKSTSGVIVQQIHKGKHYFFKDLQGREM